MSAFPANDRLADIFIAAFRLLNKRERRRVLLLILMLAFTGLVDMLALASVMPVIAICSRRPNIDPGCRLNIDPGLVAVF